ncbi:MAG: RHS repeat-associated core domain-containing protein, partial [Planctomycetota bacterium]
MGGKSGATCERSLRQVTNGSKTLIEEVSQTVNAGTEYVLIHWARRRALPSVGKLLADGYPWGKVGLVTNADETSFDYVYAADDALNADMLGRWLNNTHNSNVQSNTLYTATSWDAAYNPKLLRNVRLGRFEATFSFKRNGQPERYVDFILNAGERDEYNRLRIYHKNTANKTAPERVRIVDGGLTESVAGTGTASNMPDLTYSNTLWARVAHDGTNVTVKCLQDDVDAPTEQEWSAASLCYSTTNLGSGGHIGFGAGDGYVDDLTVKSDTDENGSFETTEVVEDFNVTSGSAEDKFEHDAAGNLTYDGLRAYAYDAWSRLAEVKRAYPDDDDGDSDCEKGSWIATLRYDALGRRIIKAVGNSADWDCTYHYYYDGWRIAEVRNGSDVMLSQNVWGLLYVDELIQTGINQTYWDTTAPIKSYMRYFWILQDANFNCLGAVAGNGRLVERYEYTPYGQRTVYGHTWNYYDINDDGEVGIAELSAYGDWTGEDVPPAPERLDYNADGTISLADYMALMDHYGQKDASGNDPRVMHPRLESGGGSLHTPVGVCDFGHQGLLYDKEFGLYQNRHRYLDSTNGRFTQDDPVGYADGMSLYQYVGSNPLTYADPRGLWGKENHTDVTTDLAGWAGIACPGKIGKLAYAPDKGWRRAGLHGAADMAAILKLLPTRRRYRLLVA